MHHGYKMKNKRLLFLHEVCCFSEWEGQCINHPVNRYTRRVGHSLEDNLIYTLKFYVNTDLLKACLAFTVKSRGLPDVLTEMRRLSSRYEVIIINIMSHPHISYLFKHLVTRLLVFFLYEWRMKQCHFCCIAPPSSCVFNRLHVLFIFNWGCVFSLYAIVSSAPYEKLACFGNQLIIIWARIKVLMLTVHFGVRWQTAVLCQMIRSSNQSLWSDGVNLSSVS